MEELMTCDNCDLPAISMDIDDRGVLEFLCKSCYWDKEVMQDQ